MGNLQLSDINFKRGNKYQYLEVVYRRKRRRKHATDTQREESNVFDGEDLRSEESKGSILRDDKRGETDRS